MDRPKISVIVPIYNTERFLDKCIQSILNQSYRNLEILLIDDGSTDKSGKLCDAYSQRDSRIRVIHKRNMGVSAARNCGLDIATGAYVAFVDSDDVIAGNMLETLHDLITKYQADISVCGYEKLTHQDAAWDRGDPSATGIFNRKEALSNFVTYYGYCGFLCNKLFRYDLFKKPVQLRLDPDIYACEDLLLTCQLTERALTVAFTEEKLYGYVSRKSFSERQVMSEKMMTSLIAKKQLIDLFSRNGLADAGSYYAYSLAVMLTYCNSKAVRKHFNQLLQQFREYRSLFNPKIHGKKERLVFFMVNTAPCYSARALGVLRSLRGKLWKKNR